ncbi:MAG: hypothetical protein LDL53_12740 [Candidatus Hydrogenedens sp.]|nr:hypothetical protein [Candidatus Hydrogenedens sp.]
MIESQFVYRGLLKGIKEIPSQKERDERKHITFYADDLAKWSSEDDPAEREWQGIHCEKRVENIDGEKILNFTGDFTHTSRLNLMKDMQTPSFWVPLTTRSRNVPHFPISHKEYPIIEITYRVQYGKSIPAWTWHYITGQFFEFLNIEPKWTTVARAWAYKDFPSKMEHLAIRLYSFTTTKETLYIHSIRFRSATDEENKILKNIDVSKYVSEKPISYPILDNIFPVGTYINANTARNMSHLLRTDLATYLDLLFEDISLHHHNVVIIENFYEFLPGDQDVLFDISKKYGIKVIIPLEEETTQLDTPKASVLFKEKEQTIKRNATRENLFGWIIKENPTDSELEGYVQIKKKIEQIDTNHPVIYLTREANAFPLYASLSSVSGLSHWKSRNPWELGQVLRTHVQFIKNGHLWAIGPTFIFGSGAPEWNSAPEIRLMINLAISSGAHGWITYSYHNMPLWVGSECQRSLTGPFLTFSDVWQELGSRLGRFFVLAPLVMLAKPSKPPDFVPSIQVRKHQRSRCPDSINVITTSWLKGNNYWLLYIVNQDSSEVTGVNVTLPKSLPDNYRVYDATQFVRTYQWEELPSSFHREMFPGQGQILLIATPEECQYWGDVILKRIFEHIERQINIDLNLLRPFQPTIDKLEEKINNLKEKQSIQNLLKLIEIRNQITDTIYATEDISLVRGKLFEAGSILCACDGVMCRLLIEGKKSIVEKYRDEVIKYAGDLIQYRLSIREGKGKQYLTSINNLSERLFTILSELRQNIST